MPHSNNSVHRFRITNNILDSRPIDPLDCRQKRPLVGVWNEVFVEEHAVAGFPRPFLQRQRDEISEAALRKCVLIGKKSVVRIQADVGSALHGFGQDMRSKPPRQRRGDRLVEENPNVCSVTGARALQRGWNAQTTASFPKCLRVLSPAFLVEIDGQEKAGFVLKHRIDAHDEILALIILTREVPPDCLIGDGEKALMRTIAAFDPGFLANALNPFVAADRLITCLARLSAFKPAWIDVLAPAKESTEQGDFRFRRRPMIDRVVEPAAGRAWFKDHRGYHGALPISPLFNARSG